MRNLSYPLYTTDENLDAASKGLNKEAKEWFRTNRSILHDAFEDYDSNVPDLHVLSSVYTTEKDRKTAFHLYRSNRPFIQKHRKELENLNDGRRLICPICEIEHVQHLDHYLPRNVERGGLPEFAAKLSNLIPTCSKCNGDKAFDVMTKANRIFNAFFDKHPDFCAFVSELHVIGGLPSIAVKVSPHLVATDPVHAVILNTISSLHLLYRVQTEAEDDFRKQCCKTECDYEAQKRYMSATDFWDSQKESLTAYLSKSGNTLKLSEVLVYRAMTSSPAYDAWIANHLQKV